MATLKEFENMQNYTTFRLGGKARYFFEINNREDLREALSFSREIGVPFFVLGAGSNTIFGGDELNLVVLKMNIKNLEKVKDDNEGVLVKIGGGEDWDKVVEWAVGQGLSGIEAMSAIPGTAGATPIQNVGAYGQEICQTLVSLEAFDLNTGEFVELKNTDCGFGYRDSVFKNKEKGRYIITSITLKLNKEKPKIPNYPDVVKYFAERKIAEPTLAEIREAIIKIRQSKLPDPAEMPNVGSFFKNIIVPEAEFMRLQREFSDLKFNKLPDSQVKIPAGWLIERAGLKGYKSGNLAVSDKNALVIVNLGGATGAELIEFTKMIQKKVFDLFGLTLEIEPNIIL